jgi:hypothetical protein
MFRLHKMIFLTVFLLIIGGIAFQAYIFISMRNSNKHLYTIEVNDVNGYTTYFTNSYVDNGQCVSFKDEFGVKRNVCGHYTISEY